MHVLDRPALHAHTLLGWHSLESTRYAQEDEFGFRGHQRRAGPSPRVYVTYYYIPGGPGLEESDEDDGE